MGVFDQGNLMDYYFFWITKFVTLEYFSIIITIAFGSENTSEAYEGELQLLESAHLVGLYLDSVLGNRWRQMIESLEMQIVKTKSLLKLGTVLALDHERGFIWFHDMSHEFSRMIFS